MPCSRRQRCIASSALCEAAGRGGLHATHTHRERHTHTRTAMVARRRHATARLSTYLSIASRDDYREGTCERLKRLERLKWLPAQQAQRQ